MSCDYDAPSTFWQKVRTARTFKRCCECRGWVKVGDRYEYTGGVWDGHGASFNTCLTCRSIRAHLRKRLGPWDCEPCFGELSEAAYEDGYWRRTWDLGPDTQWREFGGSQ